MIGRGSLTTLTVCAAALGLAACGGGESEPAVPTVPSTASAGTATQAAPKRERQSANFPAKFEKRVNAKCQRAEATIKVLAKGRYTPERFRQMRNTVEDLAADFEQTKPPARNKRAWKRYTAVVRDGADWVGQVESEVADGDVRGFYRVNGSVTGVDRRMDKLSLRYGFKDCAED
jgi:hypothetical protein